MRMPYEKHYLNLTNGIEAWPLLPPGAAWGFLRLQSTACEQKRWDFLLQDLDADFLMSLALGVRCVVWDFSRRKAVPRSLYQGAEWVRYALNRAWLGRVIEPTVRGNPCGGYFAAVHRRLEPRTRRRLAYFRRFLLADAIRLEARPGRTVHDGDDEHYRRLLADWVGAPAPGAMAGAVDDMR
jgi:hypothetical protein